MTTSRGAKDAVGFYIASNFTQVLTRARIVKIKPLPMAKLMEHPLETGAVIVDHRIILPKTIEVSTIAQAEDYKNVYRELKKLFLNGTILAVQSRADVYTNLIISEIPHEEDPTMYDALAIAIRLKEVLFAGSSSTTISPINPIDSATVTRGQTPVTTGPSSSVAEGVIS